MCRFIFLLLLFIYLLFYFTIQIHVYYSCSVCFLPAVLLAKTGKKYTFWIQSKTGTELFVILCKKNALLRLENDHCSELKMLFSKERQPLLSGKKKKCKTDFHVGKYACSLLVKQIYLMTDTTLLFVYEELTRSKLSLA